MTAMLARVRDRAWLEDERDEALRQRAIAELTFAVITACYYRRYPDKTTADYHAAANYSRQCAQADAKWYGDRAGLLAAVLSSHGGAP